MVNNWVDIYFRQELTFLIDRILFDYKLRNKNLRVIQIIILNLLASIK